jgi:hypothetical protein
MTNRLIDNVFLAFHLKIALSVLNYPVYIYFQYDTPNTNNIKVHNSVKKVKLKTSEPSGSTLSSDLQCYKTFAVESYGGMSCALHI